MNSKDITAINKMIKYCMNSKKYATDKTYDEFAADELSFVFSVFNLSQLGELITVMSDSIREKYSDIPWDAIKSIRNRIVHNYDGVKIDIIWNIIQNEIDPLIARLQNIISDMEK